LPHPSPVFGFEEPKLEAPIAYANYAYFAKVMNETGRADRIVIKTEQSSETAQSQLAQALEKQLAQANIRVRSVETNTMLHAQANHFISVLTVLLAVMAVLFAGVGGLSLTSTMSLNVLERTREIGILRAIGASDGIVAQVIIIEGIFIGLFSWLVATIISVPLSRFLSNSVGVTLLNTSLHYSFSFSGIFIWLVIAIIISTLASYLPAYSASRLSVREVLAYE
jgi:putative ABC transport system permease protein